MNSVNQMSIKRLHEKLPFSPFVDRPLSSSQMDQLVDRKIETERFEAFIEAATNGLLNNIAILGTEGSGKTTLIYYLESIARAHKEIAFINLPVLSETDREQLLLMLGRKVLDLIDVTIADKLRWAVSRKAGEDKALKDIESVVEKLVVAEEKTSASRFVLKLASLVLFGTDILPTKIIERRSLDPSLLVPLLIDISPLLKRKLRAIIVAIDEAGRMVSETTVSTLEIVSTLFQIEPWMLVLAGSPETISDLASKCPEIPNRIPPTNRITLNLFEREHTEQLLQSKVQSIKSNLVLDEIITPEAVNLIHIYSKRIPRYVILIAGAALQDAYQKNSSKIEPLNVNNGLKEFDYQRGRDLVGKLNVTQQKLLESIFKHRGASATQLARSLNYSREWVSKLLNRMERLGYLESKREEKEVKYYLIRPIEVYYTRILGE